MSVRLKDKFSKILLADEAAGVLDGSRERELVLRFFQLVVDDVLPITSRLVCAEREKGARVRVSTYLSARIKLSRPDLLVLGLFRTQVPDAVLTRPQSEELEALLRAPQDTYGRHRARVQNNLVARGLASFQVDERDPGHLLCVASPTLDDLRSSRSETKEK